MGKYFSKFPSVSYNGQLAKNILCRPKILYDRSNSPNVFYDYTLPEEQRADVVANDYYDDPDYAWLIYLANGVVDPYHDYFLSETDFNLFIAKKYGSINTAQNTIHSWVLSWAVDKRELTPAAYAALPGAHKKYWRAVVNDMYSEPTKYVRARDAHSLATNRSAFISVETPADFTVGAFFTALDEDGDEYAAQVESISGTTVGIKHIMGSISGDEYVQPADTLVEVVNIDPAESGYWVPLTYYDFEVATNALKRNISMVNKQVAFQVEKDLKKVINL
jgi:hypothetical protein